jgi:peptidyl-dipeptidase Dcp
VLKLYAYNALTGERIPDQLIGKIQRMATFNQGFMTTELTAAAIRDMDWHTLTLPFQGDVGAFEAQAMDTINLISAIVPRYRSTYFNHIFSNDYSAGYYANLWSEMLDADAFSVFEEKGLFDPVTADAFRHFILERGNTEDPMILYRRFRGADPDPAAFIRRRGL